MQFFAVDGGLTVHQHSLIPSWYSSISLAICTDATPLYIVFHISVSNLECMFGCHKWYSRTLDFLKTFIPHSPTATVGNSRFQSSLFFDVHCFYNSLFSGRRKSASCPTPKLEGPVVFCWCPSLMLFWSTVPSSIDPLHLTISEGSLIRHPGDALPRHATPASAKNDNNLIRAKYIFSSNTPHPLFLCLLI